MTTRPFKLPALADLTRLTKVVKAHVADDYRAFEGDEDPGIQLTVASNGGKEWGYQTGDNSYTGGAYSYRHWAVTGVYRHSNCRQVARDLQSQLADILWESTS